MQHFVLVICNCYAIDDIPQRVADDIQGFALIEYGGALRVKFLLRKSEVAFAVKFVRCTSEVLAFAKV